jgi:methyl-accepting chemotaxis protein
MKHARLGIAGTLWAGLGLLIVAVLTLNAGAGWISMQEMANADAKRAIAAEKLNAARQWAHLSEVVVTRIVALTDARSDTGAVEKVRARNEADIRKITEIKQRIETLPLSDADKAQIQLIAERRATVLATRARIDALQQAGDTEGARALADATFQKEVSTYYQALGRFAEMQEEASNAVSTELAASHRRHTLWSLGLMAALLALAALGAQRLISSIRHALDRSVEAARRIAEGDLTVQLDTTRQDELGQLMQALEAMARSLSGLVSQVRQATDSIHTASSEIATGNHDLSARTEQAASSLQQTASSMEQLSGTVQHYADTAREANQLATDATQAVRHGGQVVDEVVTQMDGIALASRKIADIIGVIDGIAFQTNILALNAAVEAARAGEQGRGFAVVAGEVRTLAQRSAQAAKEIKTLINDSTERVDNGAKLVDSAGQTMRQIVSAIERVNQMMTEITASASEQSDGIRQVNGAVTHLDQMTQQNAALVEEAAAAASSLRDQADQLNGLVRVFKV